MLSSQLTKPKSKKKIMGRFAKCFEATKGFSCLKRLGTMAQSVSSQVHLFLEPEHTFKPAFYIMSWQSSQGDDTTQKLLTLDPIRNLHHHQQSRCSV
jgi:hypothetical protein